MNLCIYICTYKVPFFQFYFANRIAKYFAGSITRCIYARHSANNKCRSKLSSLLHLSNARAHLVYRLRLPHRNRIYTQNTHVYVTIRHSARAAHRVRLSLSRCWCIIVRWSRERASGTGGESDRKYRNALYKAIERSRCVWWVQAVDTTSRVAAAKRFFFFFFFPF